MNLTNSSRVIKSPHHFTHHSTFSSINILSFKILEIWWLTVKMADKTQICLFAYIGKMFAKIWKIKEIWLMQRDAEGFREMQRDEQRWREMQRDAERYRHYGRYARFWEVVITDGGTDKTQGFRVELQVSGRGGGVIGTGSPCEYSVCTHPLLQFYACLHQTGQVVRYSRLHPFTSVYVGGLGRGARQQKNALLKKCFCTLYKGPKWNRLRGYTKTEWKVVQNW